MNLESLQQNFYEGVKSGGKDPSEDLFNMHVILLTDWIASGKTSLDVYFMHDIGLRTQMTEMWGEEKVVAGLSKAFDRFSRSFSVAIADRLEKTSLYARRGASNPNAMKPEEAAELFDDYAGKGGLSVSIVRNIRDIVINPLGVIVDKNDMKLIDTFVRDAKVSILITGLDKIDSLVQKRELSRKCPKDRKNRARKEPL